jgi:hypothetical protein
VYLRSPVEERVRKLKVAAVKQRWNKLRTWKHFSIYFL